MAVSRVALRQSWSDTQSRGVLSSHRGDKGKWKSNYEKAWHSRKNGSRKLRRHELKGRFSSKREPWAALLRLRKQVAQSASNVYLAQSAGRASTDEEGVKLEKSRRLMRLAATAWRHCDTCGTNVPVGNLLRTPLSLFSVKLRIFKHSMTSWSVVKIAGTPAPNCFSISTTRTQSSVPGEILRFSNDEIFLSDFDGAVTNSGTLIITNF